MSRRWICLMSLAVCVAAPRSADGHAGHDARAVRFAEPASTPPPAMMFPGLRLDGVYRPKHLAFGDINNDGHTDIAFVTRSGDSAVHVALGQGDGTFPTLLEDVAGGFLTQTIVSVEIGQYIPGGGAELAIMHSGGVTSARWHSSQSFTEYRLSDGLGGEYTATADIDGDGNLDLVGLSTSSSEYIGALFGNGPGYFSDRISVRNDRISSGSRFEIADLNGDGLLDIVVCGITGNQVWALLNDGARGFATEYWNAGITTEDGIGVGDLDNDGDQDVVTADDAGQIAVLTNTGAGELESVAYYDTRFGADAVVVSDLDGDGWSDIVVTLGEDADILMNRGDGTFADPIPVAIGGRADEAHTPDLNGDGSPDLVTGNFYDDHITILLNDGAGSFGVRHSSFSGNGSDLLLEDLDGDGDLDAAFPVSGTYTHDGDLRVAMNLGDGSFAPTVTYEDGGSTSIASGDFDGDGDPDLALGFFSHAFVSLFQNDGQGGFDRYGYIEFIDGAPDLMSADLNDDTIPDLLTPTNSGYMVVRMGEGGMSFGAPAYYPTSDSAHGLAVGDLDSDGVLDAVVAAQGLQVRFGWGDGSFGIRVDYPESLTVERVAVGDVDGDGHADVVTSDAGQVLVYLNEGTGFFLPPMSYPTRYRPRALALADADLDGDLDLFAADSLGAAASFAMNVGGGVFGDWIDLAGPEGSHSIALADMDLDGDLDLAVKGSRLHVLHNRTLTPAACPADMDANGAVNLDDVDLFVAAFLAGDLAADLDDSGALNFDDIDLFVAFFLSGCEA